MDQEAKIVPITSACAASASDALTTASKVRMVLSF